jgi:hypothetical protein
MSRIMLFSIMLLASSCYSQKTAQTCDRLILDEHSRNVLGINESTLSEYLVKNGENPENISDRRLLHELRTLICNESEVLIFDTIQHKTVEIKVLMGQKGFDPRKYLMPGIEGVYSSSLELYNEEDAPFGFMPEDTIVNYLTSIELKVDAQKIEIPVSAFEDLFFPNFCFTELSIKPIKAFSSTNGDKIFVYIFGENRLTENMAYQNSFQYSYMAKLIIDLKEGYQSRIVLRGDKLCYYNWDNCLDFTGF